MLNANALATLSNFYLKNHFTKFKLCTKTKKFVQMKGHVSPMWGYYETVRVLDNFSSFPIQIC